LKILAFNEDNLASSLSNKHTTPAQVKLKQHYRYFLKYLSSAELGAKTILIEEGYVSRDYLHDYASYYALCFENYEKVCRRVHFLDIKVTKKMFMENLLKPEEEVKEFWSHYVGFIVVNLF
jgi:hypothetical protein